ncbi:MAG TPA: hypothetical protein VLG50_02135 [Candidatus Saccharimonadales bacterium]|nr:hypothetical protein [Candidatus Saccharimonadales bacterium]
MRLRLFPTYLFSIYGFAITNGIYTCHQQNVKTDISDLTGAFIIGGVIGAGVAMFAPITLPIYVYHRFNHKE